jgi:competence protein ComEC
MSRPIYRPIIWLTISMVVGIFAGEAFPGYRLGLLLLVVGIGLGLVICLKKKRPSLMLPLLLFASMGYLSIQPWVAPRFPDHHIRHFAGSKALHITGTVLDEPVYKNNRTRFAMAVVSIMQNEKPVPVCGRLRVTVSKGPVVLAKGNRVSFRGRIRGIRNFSNPGGFDYERYMAFQHIWASTYVVAEKLSVQSGAETTKGVTFIDDRRARVRELIDGLGTESQGRSRDVKAVLKALLIGDRKEISPGLREQFNRTGVGHLLAISGLHMGIVAAAAFALFRWLAVWIKPILWAGWTRKTAAILTFLPVFLYGFLAGMSPSTQRAVIMVSVFLLTLLFDRDQDLINTICIAGMLILVINPPSLFSISFQLSFAAVLTIVGGMSLTQPMLKQSKDIKTNLINKGFTFMAVTLFATVGTAPLVMAYFNQVSLIGLVVNMLAIPLVGFLAVPLGLLSAIIQVFNTGVALWCLQMSYWILEKAIWIIDFFSGMPFAALKTVTPSLMEISLFYLLLLGFFSWIFAIQQEKQSTPPFMDPRRRVALGVMILAFLGWGLDTGYWIHQRFWHKDLRVTVFDVGQGSAALLELPGGHNLLIDGGGFSDNAVFDTGKNIIAPYLLRNKIRAIDALYLSHPNSDHLNGLIYIAEHFKVQQVITNNESSPSMGYQLFTAVLETHDIDTPVYSMLERTTTIAGVKIEILYPSENFLEKTVKEKWRNKNNNSLVVKVTFGQHAFLFPGDVMAMGEKALVAAARKNLKSTVLLSPHHGSDSSSTPILMEQVDPEIVVVSCGWKNRFKFPAESVLQRYEAMGARVLRTDINGAIRIWTDGEEMKIRTTQTRHPM